ncbi:MAG: exodeoxyribonuclease VII large subunit [Candidatus Izemoplasmatales bacterium]
MVREYLTVTALNRYLKFKFDNDSELQNVLLKAEISNFKRHSRGHLYLTLKDDSSQISAIMFVSNTSKLKFLPKDGDKVIVEGYVSVYEAYGNYQIYIQRMSLDGVGDLYLAYEKLKADLEKKGYFSEEHKLKIPLYPKSIGVITSPTGAAIRDIINIVNNRFPMTQIIVYPALVQGISAKESLVKQLQIANQQKLVDVIIIGRGGGSIEDLWAFNEEIVAKAIYDSKIPVISAVGHETDFTISDFVASVRASTPSHAAELAVRNYRDVLEEIYDYKNRARLALKNLYMAKSNELIRTVSSPYLTNPLRLIETKELNYSSLSERLFKTNPLSSIERRKDKLVSLNKNIDTYFQYYVQKRKASFDNLIEKLELVNPLNIMKKGFAIVKQNGVIKKTLSEIDKSDQLDILLTGGEITAKILEMRGNKDE